jgi:hypothetical protein
LRFLELLRILYERYGDKKFDAKMVSQHVRAFFAARGAYELDPNLRRKHSVKFLSVDLARLERMTFLKRKRAKRQVMTTTNKTCIRGWKWVYQVSSQGRSYLQSKADPSVQSTKEMRLIMEFGKKREIDRQFRGPEERLVAYRSLLTNVPKGRPGVEKRFPPNKAYDSIADPYIWQLQDKLEKANREGEDATGTATKLFGDVREALDSRDQYKMRLSKMRVMLDSIAAKMPRQSIGGEIFVLLPPNLLDEMKSVMKGVELF